MLQNPTTFEINVDGNIMVVESAFTKLRVYRLYSMNGSYVIAKDLYNVWVELNKSPGSENISLSVIGQKIDEYLGNELIRKPTYLNPQMN
jgi:hypothetical protein